MQNFVVFFFLKNNYFILQCKRDMNIIENKRLDADLTALKNRAWKSVHEEFCKVFGNERNCNRLKEQWRRMKGMVEHFSTKTDIKCKNLVSFVMIFC